MMVRLCSLKCFTIFKEMENPSIGHNKPKVCEPNDVVIRRWTYRRETYKGRSQGRGMKKEEMKAFIIGALTGDGHIQYRGWRHQVSFYSKCKEEIENMRLLFEQCYHTRGKLYPCERRQISYFSRENS